MTKQRYNHALWALIALLMVLTVSFGSMSSSNAQAQSVQQCARFLPCGQSKIEVGELSVYGVGVSSRAPVTIVIAPAEGVVWSLAGRIVGYGTYKFPRGGQFTVYAIPSPGYSIAPGRMGSKSNPFVIKINP